MECHLYGLVQDCSTSNALIMEILQFRTKPYQQNVFIISISQTNLYKNWRQDFITIYPFVLMQSRAIKAVLIIPQSQLVTGNSQQKYYYKLIPCVILLVSIHPSLVHQERMHTLFLPLLFARFPARNKRIPNTLRAAFEQIWPEFICNAWFMKIKLENGIGK